MGTFDEALKATFRDNRIAPIADHWFSGGEWVAPCMCGHHSHGYSGHCEHMCCDTDDCDCGGYEPQPGVARPRIRHEGPSPFMAMIRGGR